MLDPGAARVVRLEAALFAAAYRVGSMGEVNQMPKAHPPVPTRRVGHTAPERALGLAGGPAHLMPSALHAALKADVHSSAGVS